MDKVLKFLNRISKSERTILSQIIADIIGLKIQKYDVKALTGIFDGMFRLRKGKFRIVFYKSKNRGVIVDVFFRKDAYKS